MSISKNRLIDLATIEGKLKLKGGPNKSGPQIEKYLSVFRETLSQKDPKYQNSRSVMIGVAHMFII